MKPKQRAPRVRGRAINWTSVILVVVGLAAVLAILYRLTPFGGRIFGTNIVAPRDFFSDTAEGKDLNAKLELVRQKLSQTTNASVTANVNTATKIYADVFDSYTRDLRTTLQANFNGYVAASSQATSETERIAYKTSHDKIIEETTRRVAQLRAIQAQADAYAQSKNEALLVDLGRTVHDFVADSRSGLPTQTTLTDRLNEATSTLLDALIGPPGVALWNIQKDGSAFVVVPFTLSGETRITGNIDITPFMIKNRVLRLRLQNANVTTNAEFACQFKSNRFLQDGGDRSPTIKDGETNTVQRAEKGDGTYYLAWRGEKSTKEQFHASNKNARILLEIEKE